MTHIRSDNAPPAPNNCALVHQKLITKVFIIGHGEEKGSVAEAGEELLCGVLSWPRAAVASQLGMVQM